MLFKDTGLRRLIEQGTVRDHAAHLKAKSGLRIPVSLSSSVMYEAVDRASSIVDRDSNDERRTTSDERRVVGIVVLARDMREAKRLMAQERELAAATTAAVVDRQKAAELAQAYRALQDKTKDLERFHTLTVGRELDMIKLKDEVNALLEATGRAKKYDAPEQERALDGHDTPGGPA